MTTLIFAAVACVAMFASPNHKIGVKFQPLPVTIAVCKQTGPNKLKCDLHTNRSYLAKTKPYGHTIFKATSEAGTLYRSRDHRSLSISKDGKRFSTVKTGVFRTAKRKRLVHYATICHGDVKVK